MHTQVGSAGFFLDLAVVDPAHPGRYLLGIECDGAAYHTAHSARDRDRLRQAVLEDLGWRIHRIWSTDWFRNPDQELRKVEQAIEMARTVTPAARPQSIAPEIISSKPPQPTERAPAATPYECASIRFRPGHDEMHLIDRGQLADLLSEVVRVESPVHVTEATRRVLNGARMGARIQRAFDEAIDVGVARKLFVNRDDFLWSPTMQDAPVRDRSLLPPVSRKLELVPAEEVRRAILQLVRESCGMPPDDVPGAVCHLLGFTRMTAEMSASIELHRDALVSEGHLALEGLNLVARNEP